MKPKYIELEMSEESLAKMKHLITLAEIKDKKAMFLLQAYSNGSAVGSYLPNKEALKVQHVFDKIRDGK